MVKHTYLGFSLVILATLSYAVANILLKVVESELSHGLVVFYRFFFALLLLLPTFYLKKNVSLKTQKLKLMLLRGTTGFLMILCWTYALKFLPTATVILLTNTSPLFVPIILFLLWKEKITFFQGAIIGIGFFGVLFILHPNYHAWFSFPALVGLCSGLLLAVGLVTMRQLSYTELY
ncbi:MAG: DMT family transporter [Gammaproteobacteria bacterium]|nr:DMT family transporter [Gammaproteobacteria bacterium]